MCGRGGSDKRCERIPLPAIAPWRQERSRQEEAHGQEGRCAGSGGKFKRHQLRSCSKCVG
eukprot:5592572-Prorocentrum_lima.AAC.1